MTRRRISWFFCCLLLSCPLVLTAACGVFDNGGTSNGPDETLSGAAESGETGASTATIGNLSIREVNLPDNLEAGHEAEVEVVLYSEAPKTNVLVRLRLEPVASADASRAADEAVGLWQSVVESIEKDAQLTLTDDFVVPADCPAGSYRAVVTVNEEDYFPDDDDQQGEAPGDQEDNTYTVESAVTVTAPQYAGLEVYRSELGENSFIRSPAGPLSLRSVRDIDQGSYPDFSVSQEFAAWAYDITEPVEATYRLVIPDVGGYDLKILSRDAGGNAQLVDSITLGSQCQDAYGAPVDEGDAGAACAVLFAGSPRGRNVQLYYPDEVYLALGDEDATCTLITTLTTAQTVEPVNGGGSAEVYRQTVQYLASDAQAADATSARRAAARTKHTPLAHYKALSYGNDKFNIGLDLVAEVNYWKTELFDMRVPVRGKMEFSGTVPFTVFSYELEMLSAGLYADFDIDDISSGYCRFEVVSLGYTIWQAGDYLVGSYHEADTIILINTIDPSTGEERFSLDQTQELPLQISVYGIPVIQFTFKLFGEIGLHGEAGIDPNNVLYAALAPYVDLWAGLKVNPFTDDFGGMVGFGVDVRALKASQYVKPYFQFLPSIPSAKVGIEFPLLLETLDGKLYFWWKYGMREDRWVFFQWAGLDFEFNLIPGVSKTWNLSEKQVVISYPFDNGYRSSFQPAPGDPLDTTNLWAFFDQYRFNYVENGDEIAFELIDNPGYYVTARNGGGQDLFVKEGDGQNGAPGPNQWFNREMTAYVTDQPTEAAPAGIGIAYIMTTRRGYYLTNYNGEIVKPDESEKYYEGLRYLSPNAAKRACDVSWSCPTHCRDQLFTLEFFGD